MTKKFRVLMLAVGMAAILAVPAVVSAQAPRTLTIQLRAADSGGDTNSGVNGTATLTDIGGGRTRVDIRVSVGPGGSANMPNHVHSGRCPGVGGVVYPLNPVTNGVGTSEINATIESLLASPYAINLHRSPQEASVWVSCGNIVAGATALPATGGGPAGAAVPALAALGAALAGLAGFALRRRS